jgi:hypothetical protein
MVFVHVDGGVVNGMAAYQPVVLVCVLCGGRMKTFIVTLILFRDDVTSGVHMLDFNKRSLHIVCSFFLNLES